MAPKGHFARVFLSLSLVLVLALVLVPSRASAKGASESGNQLPDFDQFDLDVQNGQPDVIRGIYAPQQLAYRVVQQPTDNPGFVSPLQGIVTQFSLAQGYGNIGLLAHNYLAGKSFSTLATGQEIQVIYGDGRAESYEVTQILSYQALQPSSPYSDFLDLATGEIISSTTLFDLVYKGAQHLTLQTCIAQDNNLYWGRLFILAMPVRAVVTQHEANQVAPELTRQQEIFSLNRKQIKDRLADGRLDLADNDLQLLFNLH